MKYLILILALTASVFGQTIKSPGVNGENIVNPAFRNAVLPSQGSANGKFLKSNGTAASWETVTAAPSGTGFAKVTSGVWDTPSATIPHTDITGLGTAATANTGTTSGTIPLLTTGGKLPAVDGSLLSGISSGLENGRLTKFREYLDTITLAPCIAFFGDSMLEAYSTNIKLRDAFHGAFGMGGYSFLDANSGGGATGATLDFTDWFKGRYVRISASGHTATVNVDNLLPVEANTLKLYYVRKPGGGVFKVQTRLNGGTWTDEASYLTVSADGVLSSQIITITKTNLRASWEIRAIWVSGTVDIIGGALYDSASTGVRLAMLQAGSTDMVNWISSPSAVSSPIIADIAPHLCVMSHLDGAAAVTSYQATWQNSINTWASTVTPTWLVIGAPLGASDAADLVNVAQNSAQRDLATIRNDAFWDNRAWINSTPAQAVTRGYLYSDVDPHYTPLAQRNWIPLMLRDTGLAESAYRGTASGKAVIKVLNGPEIRRSRRLTAPADDNALEINGDLDLGPEIGTTGTGRLMMWDTEGSINSNDRGVIEYNANAWKFSIGAVARLYFDLHFSGQGIQMIDLASTASVPTGNMGTAAYPWRSLNLGKTVNTNATVGDQTISKACGRVWFDVGDTSNTYTNTLVTTDSIIMATVLGNDATATSVRVETVSSGSFVLTLNAAATAKTAVNFWVMP